jgi:hypothetical protein
MKKFHAHCGVLEASESKIATFISGCSTKSDMYFYGKIRQCCMNKDVLGLERLIDYLDNHNLHPSIKMLGQLRLASLMEISCTQMVDEVLKYEDNFPPLMKGEVSYVCAKVCKEIKENDRAQELFLNAQKYFTQDQIVKKAARSYFKWVQLEKIKKAPSYLLEEHAVAYQWAKEAQDFIEASKIALSLSKEYQKKQAFKTALTYANYSCELLEEHEKKSHLYLLALCQRCQVYIDLKIHDLAKKDYLKACSSHNKEVLAAVKSINF